MFEPLIDERMGKSDRDAEMGSDVLQLEPVEPVHFQRDARALRQFGHRLHHDAQLVAMGENILL